MAGSSMPPSGSSRPPKGRSRTKFFLFSMLFLLGFGFFGGVSATRAAIKGPGWVQRLFGIELPPAEQTPAVAPKPPTAPVAPVVAPPIAPTAPVVPPADKPVTATHPAAPTTSHPSGPPSPYDEQGFLGHWEITDEVKSTDGPPTNIQSSYVFNADGTGEFDSSGKKLYDLRWSISGDFLTLTYDNEQAPQGDDGAIRMRWSVSPDKTLLTLVPDNGKDARATLYGFGAGVYHKK